jgi:hypothetical protein
MPGQGTSAPFPITPGQYESAPRALSAVLHIFLTSIRRAIAMALGGSR